MGEEDGFGKGEGSTIATAQETESGTATGIAQYEELNIENGLRIAIGNGGTNGETRANMVAPTQQNQNEGSAEGCNIGGTMSNTGRQQPNGVLGVCSQAERRFDTGSQPVCIPWTVASNGMNMSTMSTVVTPGIYPGLGISTGMQPGNLVSMQYQRQSGEIQNQGMMIGGGEMTQMQSMWNGNELRDQMSQQLGQQTFGSIGSGGTQTAETGARFEWGNSLMTTTKNCVTRNTGASNWRREAPKSSQEREVSETSRKRNRLDEESTGLGAENKGAGEALSKVLEHVQMLIKAVGPRYNIIKESIEDAARLLSGEIAKLLTKVVNRQEENGFLLQQVVHLQQMQTDGNKGTRMTYVDAARQGLALDVSEGRKLPSTPLPPTIRMAPAERTLLIRTENKEGMETKQQQAEFREQLKKVIGEDLVNEVSAVRPTRTGGYAIIAASESARDRVAEKVEKGRHPPNSTIVKPKKRTARMVCRDPPDMAPNEFLKVMYNRHNPELQKVPLGSRSAVINITRLGWIFNLSTSEVIACNAQGGRLRYSFGQEARLEEFIPLQQCYNCCGYGHEARNCKTRNPRCRLCGKEGHSGRTCPTRDDRTTWRCYNCIKHNEVKGTKLSILHAAAQMHICAVAQREREVRREQLRASGVYVAPTAQAQREETIQQRRYTTPSRREASEGRTSRPPETNMEHVSSMRSDRTRRRDNSEQPALPQVAEQPKRREGREGRGRGGQVRKEGPRTRAQSRVRWGGREESSDQGGGWSTVRGRGRRGGAQSQRNPIRTPGSPVIGRTPSGRMSTPGTEVRITSDIEDDDLDL